MSPAERQTDLTPLQRAYLALEEMSSKVDALERERNEPIAIVGMACRFPGGVRNPAEYWHLLYDGVDAVSEVPADRWDVDTYYDPDPAKPGKMSTRWGAFLDDVDQFDPGFFGISPREAALMDPQQRLLLEVAWEALEDAGQPSDSFSGSRSGVYVGLYNTDYAHLQNENDAYAALGSSPGVTAGRIAYSLDLQGPAMLVDTLCSSSLVAAHLACQGLRRRECDLALAGGVNLILSPLSTIVSSRLQALAPDGRCKTFDARANGYVRGEGCGIVVLKRLSDALAGGDPIWAVIRGSAVNQDGRSTGLTTPNVLAQQAVIRQALADANLEPWQIGYVETHGTGTALGDPIEVEALQAVYGQSRPDSEVCALGAVKTNLGHLEAASGIAGLIKAVLSLRHQTVPANLHFRQLNPRISIWDTPFVIPTEARAWPAGAESRLAAVSSFGISGTNAHLILEEAPRSAIPAGEDWDDRNYLLPLSARSPEALRSLVDEYHARFATPADRPSLYDACFTAATRRSHHSYRTVLSGGDWDSVLENAERYLQDNPVSNVGSMPALPFGTRPKVVFVLPGQGGQWPGMGRELYDREPAFRDAFRQCDAAFDRFLGWSLADYLEADPPAGGFDRIDVVQPLLFAFQIALAGLFEWWGIVPDALIGHSVGEVAAAYLAGALSLSDACQVVGRRSRLLHRIHGEGAMALVELPLAETEQLLRPYADRLSVAVNNGPRHSVISGDPAALQKVLDDLERQAVFCRRIQVDVAAHSPQVNSLQEELADQLSGIVARPPHRAIYSTVSGGRLTSGSLDAAYWMRNLRQPVRFWEAMQQVAADGHQLFVEISPHPVLLPALQDGLRELGVDGATLATLRREEPERALLMEALGALYSRGCSVNWQHLYPDGRHVDLPTYPWQHKRYWIEERDGSNRYFLANVIEAGHHEESGVAHPLLGRHVQSSAQVGTHIWESVVDEKTVPFLSDHRVEGMAVFPAAGYIDLVLAAAETVYGPGTHVISDVDLASMFIVHPEGRATLQLVISPAMPGSASFQCAFRDDRHVEWTVAVTGIIRIDTGAETPHEEAPPRIRARCADQVPGSVFYKALADNGLGYGPAFQGVGELLRSDGEALAQLVIPPAVIETRALYRLHPALLDSCFQVFAAAIPRDAAEGAYLPVHIESVRMVHPPADKLWAHARLQGEEAGGFFTGTITVLDEEGRAVVVVEGFRIRRLDVSGPDRHDPIDDLLYRLAWRAQPLDAVDREGTATGTWMIVGDGSEIDTFLRQRLNDLGERCLFVTEGSDYREVGPDRFQVSRAQPESFQHLLKQVISLDLPPMRGVLYLAGLNKSAERTQGVNDSAADAAEAYLPFLTLVQALAQSSWRDVPRLWLLTEGTQAIEWNESPRDLARSTLWGLARTVALEHPELRCARIDLGDRSECELEALVAEMVADTVEDQIGLRGNKRYVARLVHHRQSDDPEETPATDHSPASRPASDRPFRLEIDEPGVLDRLTLQEVSRRVPGPEEVEIAVEAAGLNFLDVLGALAARSDDGVAGRFPLGAECAGHVVAVGDGVKGLRPGDAVVALAPHAFGRFVTTRAEFVVGKPEHLSFAEAAGLPIVFLTAAYALEEVAALRAGERVLIHSAAGGTGLAAVQIARRLGAEVFATAGNEEKREYLKSIGIRHVFDSRSLRFADEVLAATAGQGVDLVLNSLAGQAMERSFQVLAPYGRFLEIGKRDIYQNSRIGLQPFQKSLTYVAIDLAGLAMRRPRVVATLLRDVIGRFNAGELHPSPIQVYPIAEATAAFHHMAQARHIGKIVLSLAEAAETSIAPAPSEPVAISADHSYLITGGLGGLGLVVARRLVDRGARHLLLVGRDGPTPAAESVLKDLHAAGAKVRTVQADVADEQQVAAVVDTIEPSMPPLRGVIHAAAVLDDGILLQQNADRLHAVLRPKVDGALNLHQATRHLPLDFFVLFSSAASLLGSPGQANYAAANAFLDALAAYRRAEGLPALSINWGPWAGVGQAAQQDRGSRMAALGIESLSPDTGIAILDRLLDDQTPQVAAIALNVRHWQQLNPGVAGAPFYSEIARDDGRPRQTDESQALRARLLAAEPAGRAALLEECVVDQIARVLRMTNVRIERTTPLNTLGLDSLMALELRNRLESGLGISLPATLVWAHPTLAALVPELATRMDVPLAQTIPESEAETATTNVIPEDGADLDDLSEEGAAALLTEKLALLDREYLA